MLTKIPKILEERIKEAQAQIVFDRVELNRACEAWLQGSLSDSEEFHRLAALEQATQAVMVDRRNLESLNDIQMNYTTVSVRTWMKLRFGSLRGGSMSRGKLSLENRSQLEAEIAAGTVTPGPKDPDGPDYDETEKNQRTKGRKR